MRAKRNLRFALPQDTFRLISSLPTTNEIWKRSKELYSEDAYQTHYIKTILLLEFGSFKQKFDESINQVANRFIHLLSRMLKYELKISDIKQKVTFMNGLTS